MTRKLRVGIAGYGVVGQRRRHFIDLREDMETVAVCDKKFDSEGMLDDGVKYFTSYDRLLEEKLDVLFVCLINELNPLATMSALKSGLHVFCEKPPGRTLADIKNVRAVEKTVPNLKLQYGFNHRYHDSVKDALEIIESNQLGRVINLRGVYGKSQLVTFEQSNWRTIRSIAGGGVLLDQGIHMVDLLRLFAGEFTEIHSYVSNDFWGHDVEDNAYALMRTANGTVALFHSSATQWRHQFNLEVGCEKGSLILSGILSGSKSYGAETLTIAYRANNDMGDPREETRRYNQDPSWEMEINDFARLIETGDPVVNGSSLEALKTMELVYGIYSADANWRKEWLLQG